MAFEMFNAPRPALLLPMCLVLACLTGCGSGPQVPGFDQEAWRQDKRGCQGKRASLLADFEALAKPALLKGLRELETKQLLGSPDQIEVAERGQKFYTYFLEPGNQCQGSEAGQEARRIRVRFSALNQVNEITLIDLRN
jgi:hypothetical protein